MGSSSDWETMQAAADTLTRLSIAHEVRVISAHRTPDLLFEYAASARERGLKAIIAGAGGAAHLPGMTAAKTSVPVLGVPIQSKALNGIDSFLSIAQMPSGVPVATFAIGVAGATNAALFAAAMLANEDAGIRTALDAFRAGANRGGYRQAGSAPLLKLMHVGIVGAGQLGRMLALSGYPIGVRCLFLDRSADTPGAQVAPSLIGDLEDAALLAELAARSDVVTFDWENISGGALKPLEKITQVRPPRAALEVSQDRLAEKALFTRLKIPVAAHCAIDSREELIRGDAENRASRRFENAALGL